MRARRARPKLASREKCTKQGEGAFVSGSLNRVTPREKSLRYDETVSGQTLYAYVGGNPLSRVDPLGLQAEEESEEERFEEWNAMFPKIGPNQVGRSNIIEDQLREGTCRAPTGRSGNPLRNPNYQPGVNDPANINGIDYSGHALDQMQNRGFVPSVIENTINNGEQFDTRPGTTGYYDSVNNVRVIVNSNTGNVITVIPGVPSGGGK